MLSDFQVRYAFAHGLNYARVFGAGHKGQGRLHLVLVLNNQQIGKVQRSGFDLDQHLARFGAGCWQLLPAQFVYANRVLAKPGMHGVLQSMI